MICSHNTFTFLKPIKWWMKLFTPFARCQRNGLDYQISAGVEVADIRLRWSKKHNCWYVCHGKTLYISAFYAISCLYHKGIDKIRILIEGNPSETQLDILKRHIRLYQTKGKVIFYEGRYKNNWQKQFMKLPSLEVNQLVGSMQSWYGKMLPILYNLINKDYLFGEFLKARTSSEVTSFDFI